MRRQMSRSPAGVVLAVYLLAFLVLFFYSIFAFPAGEEGMLPRFHWPFVWSNSFLLFMNYCLPVTMAAVAVSCSAGGQRSAWRAGALEFGHMVSGSLGFLIALAVIYSVVQLALVPQVGRNLEDLHSLSRRAALHLGRAEAAEAAGDRAAAVEEYEGYLAIDPDNDRIADRARELQTGPQGGPSGGSPAAVQEPESARYQVLAEGRQAHELMDLARGFQEKEDYISAHYFYSLAARIDPTRADARRLAAAAWERIGEAGPDAEDRERFELYRNKQEAYRLFDAERYAQAYYQFLSLLEAHPRDGELATWLERSRRMVMQETFFLEEARGIDALPGRERLLFLNRAQGEEWEILYIGKMATIEEGTFFKDIEVLRVVRGRVAQHFVAAYGRLADGAINLHGIQRSSPGAPSLPRFLIGRSGPADAANVLALQAGPKELPLLSVGRMTEATVGFLELWQMRPRLARYGHPETAVSAEILRRLLFPFSFLVLAVAAAAFGWSARHLSGRPEWIAYLFVPLFPLVALFFSSLYLHAQRILLNFCLLQADFSVALLLFLLLQGLLLFLVLAVLAGQTAD